MEKSVMTSLEDANRMVNMLYVAVGFISLVLVAVLISRIITLFRFNKSYEFKIPKSKVSRSEGVYIDFNKKDIYPMPRTSSGVGRVARRDNTSTIRNSTGVPGLKGSRDSVAEDATLFFATLNSVTSSTDKSRHSHSHDDNTNHHCTSSSDNNHHTHHSNDSTSHSSGHDYSSHSYDHSSSYDSGGSDSGGGSFGGD